MKWTPAKTMIVIVGDILNFTVDVIVSEDDGVFLFFQRVNLVHQVERIFFVLRSGSGNGKLRSGQRRTHGNTRSWKEIGV